MLKQQLSFYKYQGAGNDFIMVDNRDMAFNHHFPDKIAKLCDRRFGVGGDGIMFLELTEGFDFKMVYYNADGNPSSMCGNGGRCIVAFAKFLGIIDYETNFLAVDGPHYAKIADSGDWVSLQMIDVEQIKKDGDDFVLNTGSPHYVKFADDVANKNVFTEGRAIRYNNTYSKEGININFVEDKNDYLLVRTYERGVEDETYACGTGVTAVALANAYANNTIGYSETAIKVLGGDLNIRFNYDGKKFDHIFLEGPAKQVFKGEIAF
ncbi:diaminopimelate epimerase [Pedobacter alpinus]|uniref:Diaminopimelate epimerase n=1 Tax=Pedobacter alpinus TaxID=1590643 RepID=A0ABW5TQ43_9SPHI